MSWTNRCSRRLSSSILQLALVAALALPPPAGGEGPPSEIVFATYLGGSLWDEASDLAVDAQGHVWVTGTTASHDFPGAGAPPEPALDLTEPTDGFLVRLDSAGALTSSAYVGTAFSDRLEAIALDSSGNPWEVGTTSDSAVLLARRTSATIFNRFNPSERGHDIAFDAGGNLYILAGTEHGFDIFVQKRRPTGQEVYVTGLSPDYPQALAVSRGGSAYVLGGGDALIKLDPAGNQVPFPRPLASGIADLAVDAAGNLHVVGTLNENLFYARLNPAGRVITSLSIGGSRGDYGRRIALGPAGDVALLGFTESPDFPLARPVDAECPASVSRPEACKTTPVVIRLIGTTVLVSTYLNLGESVPSGVALGSQGDLYVAGLTYDPAFPTVHAIQPFLNGPSDAFVLRITGNLPPDCRAAVAQPAEIWPPNGRLVPVAIQGVTDPEGGRVALIVTGIRQDEPLTKPGLADAAGVGSPTARVRADRAGGGDGRVYSIRFEARDKQGAVCTGTVTACVPHDRGRGRRCVDGGPLFDSTAATR